MTVLPQVLVGSYGGAAPVNPFSLIGNGSAVLGGASTTVTLSGITFPGGNVVIAFGHGNSGGNAATVSGATINGVAASIDVVAANAVAVGSAVLSAVSVPAGVGDIVITFTTSNVYTLAWAAYDIGTRTLQAVTSTNATVTAISNAVNVNADGVVISACHVNLNSHTSDFNAGVVTDQRSSVFPTNRYAMVGSQQYVSTTNPATVTTSAVSSSVHRSATASYS